MQPLEEQAMAHRMEALEMTSPVMHGTPARRQTAHFGWLYGYEGGQLHPGPEMPGYLVNLRERAARLVDLPPESFAEALVTRYPPGAGIGWHRDAPQFGPVVVGISFLGACRLRLRWEHGALVDLYEIDLDPRSAYVLRGQARWQWQHGIPPCRSLRYSVTFRTLREPSRRADRPSPHPDER